MNIRTKLQTVGTLPFALVIIIGLIIFSMGRQISKAGEKDAIASEIVAGVFQKTSLRDEYLINHGERTKAQWYLKQESVSKLLMLASEKFKDGEERIVLDEMRGAHERTGHLFSQLVVNYERANAGEMDSTGLQELNDRLVGQLLIDSQTIVSDALQLSRISHAKLSDARQKGDMSIVVSVIILAGGIGFASFFIGRNVAQNIRRLHEATEIIAGGNLGYEIPVRRGDEIGQLTRAFNEMTGNLRKSYDDLEKEVAVRKVAEEELKQYQEHLEELVEKRTAELQCANERLHHEITERKKAEEKIKKLNEDLRRYVTQLEAAIKELEAFSYSVSHDLRAPLRAIDGFSKILLEYCGPNLDGEGMRLLTIVRDNAKKMGQLIDDILSFSRVGRRELQVTGIDMEEIARAVAEELRVPETGRNVEIRIGDLPSACGDPAMMRQVFVNLFSNAIKFTKTKDTATIEAGFFARGVENVYYVKDNGVGFDMNYAHKLFGVFQRLHSAEEFEGTGIGLAIVNRIITKHGGRVWAEGKVNEGATFFFSLPERVKPDSQSGFVPEQGG